MPGPQRGGKNHDHPHLLGFLKADRGRCIISGLDCRRRAAQIQKFLGYLPEESTFFEDMTGMQFLNFMSEMRGIRDRSRRAALVEVPWYTCFQPPIPGSKSVGSR